jgi:hypothetical protein
MLKAPPVALDRLLELHGVALLWGQKICADQLKIMAAGLISQQRFSTR